MSEFEEMLDSYSADLVEVAEQTTPMYIRFISQINKVVHDRYLERSQKEALEMAMEHEKEVKQMKKDHKKHIKKKDNELAQLRKEMKELKSKYSKMKKKRKKLKKRVEELEEETDNYDALIKQLSAENTELEEKLEGKKNNRLVNANVGKKVHAKLNEVVDGVDGYELLLVDPKKNKKKKKIKKNMFLEIKPSASEDESEAEDLEPLSGDESD